MAILPNLTNRLLFILIHGIEMKNSLYFLGKRKFYFFSRRQKLKSYD